MHYYQWNIGDYQSHTTHLSEMEDLAYRRMLDWCYLHEQPLPLDVDEVAWLIRMRSHSDCIAIVLRHFFERTDHGWVNPRVQREMARYSTKSEKARKSAQARWSAPKDANALPTQSEGNANQEPITKNQEPKDLPPTVVVPQDKPGAPDCPHGEIVELYHECCPTLARVMVLSPKRQGLIRQRWREVWSDLKWDRAGGLVWFREFFESVNRSDFLTGRAKTDRPWQADLEWLMLPTNFVKVAEGRYNKGK
jgi:uncharacterized protein YdaU (DUF1376 family)